MKKTIKVIKCVCGCGERLELWDFGDNQVEINIFEKGKKKSKSGVVLEEKELKLLIKYLDEIQFQW